MIVLAARRGHPGAAFTRALRAGLLLSLVGDVALLWPQQGFLPGLVAFLLAHLAYLVAFSRELRFGAQPRAFVAYALLAAGVLALLWPGVPGGLRWPVAACVVCLGSYWAAQWLIASALPARR